jgi:hypothetical protein
LANGDRNHVCDSERNQDGGLERLHGLALHLIRPRHTQTQ